jgi:aminoglycoside 2''-phosphotransferase
VFDIDQIARGLTKAFADVERITPVRVLGEGFSSLAVETAGGMIFRIAKTAPAGARFAKEYAHLASLQPYLPVAIPQPQWYLPNSDDFPFGVIGYVKLPGDPLEPEYITSRSQAQEIAGQIANFILALQGIPTDQFSTLRPTHDLRASRAEQRDKVMPALRILLQPDEYGAVVKWWEAFLADERLSDYTPVVLHGDFWYGNLLFEGSRLAGVVDFEELAIGDPALDFVPQLYLGETFLKLVVDTHRDAGGVTDEHFEHRLRASWAFREFGGLQYALEYDATELDDAIYKLRQGPILNRSGVDAWRGAWEDRP